MQRIYMHCYREGQESQFSPEKLLSSQTESLGHYYKPSYGLWGSAFTDKSDNQWERFFSIEFNPNAFKCVTDIEKVPYDQYPEYLKNRGLTMDEYNQLDSETKQLIDVEYEEMFPTPTSEEYKRAEEMDAQNRLRFVADMRENSFFFAVDQSKILHIRSSKDIEPYLTQSDYGVVMVDYDKIRNSGYSGLELHNARELHNTVFYSWDVDSIVIWDPSCVIPVDKEIAHIARSIAEATNKFDTYDRLSDDVKLGYWIANNIHIVDQAIANGILEQSEVAKFIEHAIDMDNARRVINTQTIECSEHVEHNDREL